MFSSSSTIGDSILTELEEILGAPVLLEGEDSGSYYRLRELLRNGVSPTDTIEALWVRDIADLTWESLRYRRWKSAFHRFAEIDGADCQRRSKNLPLGGAKVCHFGDLSSEL